MNGGVFDLELVEDQIGMVVLIASGKGVETAFRNEAGGHRWQHVSKTDRKGRIHTSTITVAVLPVSPEMELIIPDKDLHWVFCRAGGPGGQHVNKTNSAAKVTHLPSGLTVRCESERSQTQNKATALTLLAARLSQAQKTLGLGKVNENRRGQIGTGMRADKTITIRVQDDTVVSHITGKRTTATRYLKGHLEDLS